MHAVSPQLMMWDSTSGAIPMSTPDLQPQILTSSSYPAVFQQHLYSSPDSLTQVFTGTPLQNIPDMPSLVWMQTQSVATREESEGSCALINPTFASGQVQLHPPHHGVLPVFVNSNRQRLLLNHPIHHVPSAHQTAYCQITPDQQHDGLHLINVTNLTQNVHHASQLASLPQDLRLSLPLTTLHEKQANSYFRPRLTPKRRNGSSINAFDNAVSWRKSSDERSLGGMNTALRRRSLSAELEGNSNTAKSNVSGSPTPIKRMASSTTDVDLTNKVWRSPDPRTLRKLVDIIEYYFSDECLSKNGYMLKQLSNGGNDGYISIRRVAALKRVKSQTKDIRAVTCAVRQSTLLEMDEEGTMIRRKRPLPENIETPRFIRSVLAINLPKDVPSVEDITVLFTPFGELTQVRVLRPGKAIPAYLRDYTAWVPDLGIKHCAIVEFENQEEAQKACREINMQNRGPNCLRVALLKPGARIRRTLYRKYKDESVQETNEDSHSGIQHSCTFSSGSRERSSSDSSSGNRSPIVTHSAVKVTDERNDNSNNNNGPTLQYDASGSGSETGSDEEIDNETSIDNRSESPTERPQIRNGDSGYSHSSSSDEKDSWRRSSTSDNDTDNGKPNLSRRQSTGSDRKYINGLPVGVERYPKGPISESKGFQGHRSVFRRM